MDAHREPRNRNIHRVLAIGCHRTLKVDQTRRQRTSYPPCLLISLHNQHRGIERLSVSLPISYDCADREDSHPSRNTGQRTQSSGLILYNNL